VALVTDKRSQIQYLDYQIKELQKAPGVHSRQIGALRKRVLRLKGLEKVQKGQSYMQFQREQEKDTIGVGEFDSDFDARFQEPGMEEERKRAIVQFEQEQQTMPRPKRRIAPTRNHYSFTGICLNLCSLSKINDVTVN